MTMRTDGTGAPPQGIKEPKKADMGTWVGVASTAAAAAVIAHDIANLVSPVTGAASNARTAKAIGKSLADKGKAGSKKASARAAAKVAEKAAVSPAMTMLGRVVNSTPVGVLSRLALPVLAGRMAYDGYQGYQTDGVRGAMLGAADAATIGLASRAYDRFIGGRTPPPNAPSNAQIASMPNQGADPTTTMIAARGAPEPQKQLPAPPQDKRQDMAAFDTMAGHYEASHMAEPPQQAAEENSDGKGKRGFANPKVQRAAQEARGVQNYTSWAE